MVRGEVGISDRKRKSAAKKAAGNVSDAAYDSVLEQLQRGVTAGLHSGGMSVFRTDCEDKLWKAYLSAFPVRQRQHHNCHECRNFIERFGGLVTIDEAGVATSLMWSRPMGNPTYDAVFAKLNAIVKQANVTGVYLASGTRWGNQVTGVWKHFSVHVHHNLVWPGRTKTADQAMAEKIEDRRNVESALDEFTLAHLTTAVTLLEADALYRSEKVLGPAKWLLELQKARMAAKSKRAKANVVWRAVAKAPAGFCHPRSSMIGSLLEDLVNGLPLGDVQKKFAAKMAPDQYLRPQSAPAAGTIQQAEKIVAQLGIVNSLRRRFASLAEVPKVWERKLSFPSQVATAGVFGHLAPRKPELMTINMGVMTWRKFREMDLAGVTDIQMKVDGKDSFAAIVTAVDPHAPPIIRWDHEGARNPFSWYTYVGGAEPYQWNLASGWVNVTAITKSPEDWNQPGRDSAAFFILENAKDRRQPGLCLFPEILKPELHEVRSVIEAHSRSGTMEGTAFASACGLMRSKSAWNGSTYLRLESSKAVYLVRVDRWD